MFCHFVHIIYVTPTIWPAGSTVGMMVCGHCFTGQTVMLLCVRASSFHECISIVLYELLIAQCQEPDGMHQILADQGMVLGIRKTCRMRAVWFLPACAAGGSAFEGHNRSRGGSNVIAEKETTKRREEEQQGGDEPIYWLLLLCGRSPSRPCLWSQVTDEHLAQADQKVSAGWLQPCLATKKTRPKPRACLQRAVSGSTF